MGARGEEPWPRAKKIICALGVAFVILTVSIIAFALAAEGTYTARNFKSHSPILIDGNADFGLENGVSSGSGTKTDPFMIEGLEISAIGTQGIAVRNTDSYLIIRNVSVDATWSFYRVASSSVGILLDNASNIMIESSFISACEYGVRVNGTLGATKGVEISKCTFTSNSKHVVVSNISDCQVTRSFFLDFNRCVLSISNCTSVSCSFNTIEGSTYNSHYDPYRMTTIRIENVTGCKLEENDIDIGSTTKSVWVVDTDDATITNNSVECYSNYHLVAERCTHVLMSRNEFTAGYGVSVEECSNASVDGNYLHGNQYSTDSPTISATNSVDAVISDNVIIRGGGIDVASSRDTRVHDNYVAYAGYTFYNPVYVMGMWTHGCNNISISRNVFTNGTASGLEISGTNITVEGNEISRNNRGHPYTQSGAGLIASGSNLSIRHNWIFSNTISSATASSPGIMLTSCSKSAFEANNISDDFWLAYCDNLTVKSNTYDGSWNLSVRFSDAIVFEQNNFKDPIAISLYGDSTLTDWDAGYPAGGNYWQSYIGIDLMSGPDQDLPGPDGFGDTAYQVLVGAVDHYPRMQPVNAQDILPPVTFAILDGTMGHRMWYTSNVSATLIAFDSNASTLDISYSLDSGPWRTYVSVILVAGDGAHSLRFFSEDDQGNLEETKTVEIRVDTNAPSAASVLKKEYTFRTKTFDTRYIYAHFNDSSSGFGYSSTTYSRTYDYPWMTPYSSCDWLKIIPETGRKNATIEAVDEAGNSCTYVVTIDDSVSPNIDPFNHKGPYGWWLILAALVDAGVGLAALGVFETSREKTYSAGKRTTRGEGERHYDEDVVDGYPKFMRKI